MLLCRLKIFIGLFEIVESKKPSDEEDSSQKYSRMEDDNIQDKERFASFYSNNKLGMLSLTLFKEKKRIVIASLNKEPGTFLIYFPRLFNTVSNFIINIQMLELIEIMRLIKYQ
ncbi:aryl hydrocarbon receptor nuclear translocator isoform X3 [Aphis craccivora]|uniref:Aryl hydrocarbon receptor nuclear translocator isoform X3 n=1 Tax=Aphis craccivora TaxID=307492 RepID=A0A6G0ZCM6_APHCR|nr:aryl hydrocarbon receptor nuclear translocator isoform X3 [Aphis craccivora]